MRYTQTILMTVVGLGLAGFWLFTNKAVMAHHMPDGSTLARAVILLAVAVSAGFWRDRRAYSKKLAKAPAS